ncbi:MAG: flagellar hook-length control protein FliK [Pacificimonas sp.]
MHLSTTLSPAPDAQPGPETSRPSPNDGGFAAMVDEGQAPDSSPVLPVPMVTNGRPKLLDTGDLPTLLEYARDNAGDTPPATMMPQIVTMIPPAAALTATFSGQTDAETITSSSRTSAPVVAPPPPESAAMPELETATQLLQPQIQAATLPQPSSLTPQAAQPAPEVVLPARPAHLAADVGLEIVRQVAGGKSDFTIRLDPPELGRIEVRLELAPTGDVRGVIAADNPATHEMLRRDEAALYRLLAEQGLKADSGALAFEQRRRAAAGRHGFAESDNANADSPEAPQPRRSSSLLDLVT